MTRTLLRIPRMFTREDLSRIDSRLPEDFDDKSEEFWGYVDERFKSISGRLKKIYLESSGVMGKRHLDMLKTVDPPQYDVVNSALDSGAELLEAESPELVLETLSWMQRMQDLLSGDGADEDKASAVQSMAEMLQESVKERNEWIKNRIESTLQEGEVGALLMDLSREIEFSKDIRVIITCPFRPRDYLNSWLTSLRVKDQMESGEADEKEDSPEEKGEEIGE